MSRKQTRKSISVSREAYAALRARCDLEGVSLSSVVEQFIRDLCDLERQPDLPPKERAAAMRWPHGHAASAGEREMPHIAERQTASRDELDAIAATRVAMQTAEQRTALRSKLDEVAEARAEAAAIANPCRRNCGDLSLHAVGRCKPERKRRTA